ncbi:MAG: urease accessory protein UreF, partial [Thiohalomonadales bacterium]
LDMTNPHHQEALCELRLWQLISATLPVGAYAYSQGLEFAVEEKWVHDFVSCRRWIGGQLENNLCGLDVPILRRIYLALEDNAIDNVVHWNRYLLSSRETQELYDEDCQLGIALVRLLSDLQVPKIQKLTAQCHDEISFVTTFSLAAHYWKIPAITTARGYLWSWCENQVAAAVKLIPLGQTDGQRLLADLALLIPRALEHSWQINDDDIGNTSQGIAIASAFHESQYTRLFRS